MEKEHMYINEQCKVDALLPKQLLDDCKSLDELFDNDDIMGFAELLEVFVPTIKQCKLSGRITAEQQMTLMRRYGLK